MPATARKKAQWMAANPRSVPLHKPYRARKGAQKFVGLGRLNEHLGYFIRRAQVWIFQDFIRTLKSLDISPAQYSVLHVIEANRGLSQSELGAALGIERARLVRMLHRLDKRGLTRRLQSSADGRTHALRLTTKGQEALRRAQELAAQHEARLIEGFGAKSYKHMKALLRDFRATNGQGLP